MLERCPDCGHEISPRARMCPNCGAPGPGHEEPEPKMECKGPVASLIDTTICLIMFLFFLALVASAFESYG